MSVLSRLRSAVGTSGGGSLLELAADEIQRLMREVEYWKKLARPGRKPKGKSK